MRKYLLIGLLFWPKWGFASDLNNLWQDIQDNTHMVIAESATPSYIYNIAKGRSEVGATTGIFEYRFISGDVGYSTGYQDKTRGTVLLGGSIHFDKLASQFFPRTAAITNATVALVAPNGLNLLWQKLFIGFFVGKDLTEMDLNYGIQTGFQFKWSN